MTLTLIFVAFLVFIFLLGRGPTHEQRDRAIDTLTAVEKALMEGRLKDNEWLDIELGRARKRVLLGTCEVGRFRLARRLNPPWYVRRRWFVYLPDEMLEAGFTARDPLAAWIDALVRSGPEPHAAPYRAVATVGRMTALFVLVESSFVAVMAWLLAFVRPSQKAVRIAVTPVLKSFCIRLYSDGEPEGGRPAIGQIVTLPDQDLVTYRDADTFVAVLDRKRRCRWVLVERHAPDPERPGAVRRIARHEAKFPFRHDDTNDAAACAGNLIRWPAAMSAKTAIHKA